MRLSQTSPSFSPVSQPPRPQFGSGRMVPFDVEDHYHHSTRSHQMGRKTVYGLVALGVLGSIGAILTGVGIACNTKPGGAAASLRMNGFLQVPDMCPKAYLKEDGDVIHPLLRYKDGHIDETGKASGKLGIRAKGSAKDGKVYENFWGIDGAQLPLPKFKVEADGDVKDGITNFPRGKINTLNNKELPRNQRDALALWG